MTDRLKMPQSPTHMSLAWGIMIGIVARARWTPPEPPDPPWSRP